MGEADYIGPSGQGEDFCFCSEGSKESLYCFKQRNDII